MRQNEARVYFFQLGSWDEETSYTLDISERINEDIKVEEKKTLNKYFDTVGADGKFMIDCTKPKRGLENCVLEVIQNEKKDQI